MSGFILMPLLLGVLTYGHYFWIAQRTPLLDPNFDQAGIVGSFCPNQVEDLLTRVRAATLVAIENVDSTGALPVAASGVTARVLDYVPGRLGVVVGVSVTTNAIDGLLSFLPLPRGGRIVSDAQVRLSNVVITSGTC